jgi:hypothetical protein
MTKIATESLVWLDKVEAINASHKEGQKPNQASLVSQYGFSPTHASYLSSLRLCFDKAAIGRVRQAALGNPPYTLSFTSAKELTRLKGKVPDLPAAVHAALDQILPHHLPTKKIEALVDHMASKKPASEFDPEAKPPKKAVKPPRHQDTKETQTLGQRLGAFIDGLLGKLPVIPGQTGPEGTGLKTSPAKPAGRGKKSGQTWQKGLKAAAKWLGKDGKWTLKKFLRLFIKVEHAIAKWVANLVVPHGHSQHSSHKRGGGTSFQQHPFRAILHWAVYSLCQFVILWVVATWLASRFFPSLQPWVEFPFRFLAHLVTVDFPAWLLPFALHHWIIALVLAGVLFFFAIVPAFSAEPFRVIVLAVLLGAAWFYGRGWGTRTLPSLTASTADAPVTQAAVAPVTQAPITAVPVSPIPPKKTARTGPAPEPAIPEGREEEVEGDRRMIDEITEDLFKMSHQNYSDMIDDLKSHLDHDYEEEFLSEFVPDEKIKELRDGWLYLSFGYSEPVKLLKVDDDSETFLAQGTVYTQSDTNAKVAHPRRKVAITIHVVHNGKKEGKVDEVKWVTAGN